MSTLHREGIPLRTSFLCQKVSCDIGFVTAKEFISMWKNSTYRKFLPNGCIVTLPRFQVRVNSAHKINIYHPSNFSRRYRNELVSNAFVKISAICSRV